MRVLIVCLALLLPMLFAQAAPQPAGYVVAFELQGEDLAKGTSIVRGGKEFAPQIYMPLFDGDAVFVRDAASRVVVDVAGGGRREVGGALLRMDIAGQMAASDDAWAIIESIGALIAGSGGEETPTNLVSKGTGISVPWAAPGGGPNLILADGGPLQIVWSGGEGPFKIVLEADGAKRELSQTSATVFALDPPDAASFAVIISDSAGSLVRLKFKTTAPPSPPEALLASAPTPETANILVSAWLAREASGTWRQEALRRLAAVPGDEAAAKLLAAIAKGWQG